MVQIPDRGVHVKNDDAFFLVIPANAGVCILVTYFLMVSCMRYAALHEREKGRSGMLLTATGRKPSFQVSIIKKA